VEKKEVCAHFGQCGGRSGQGEALILLLLLLLIVLITRP